jgi:hypothetical protein
MSERRRLMMKRDTSKLGLLPPVFGGVPSGAIERMKGANLKCCYCYGAWNDMDRWFMQECVCRRPCAEPRCKRRKR